MVRVETEQSSSVTLVCHYETCEEAIANMRNWMDDDSRHAYMMAGAQLVHVGLSPQEAYNLLSRLFDASKDEVTYSHDSHRDV